VGQRRYHQHCALAKSLDVLGDRWTLLVVRDLLDGPQRYVDLHAGLMTIPTDTLAARLKHLEQHGVVTRRQLPPPADRAVYELTDSGRALEPVIDAFARWGRPLVEQRAPDDAVRPQWLARAVRSLLRADRQGVDLTLALRTPDGDLVLHITEDEVVSADPEAPVDVTLTGAVEDLVAAVDPTRVARLVAAGRLTIEGSRAHTRALAAAFDSGAAS
jgi:DNA-binding HxlR family transcriptional regulator